ncbi:MAG TPA: hypothetical protein VFS54_11985 [Solirubrobacterales bacterium]|nr:hypothetical protein [Solirubrobacterales bacterium]
MSKRLLLFVVLLAIGTCAIGAGPAAAKSRPGNVDFGFGDEGTVIQPRNWGPVDGFYGPFGEDMAVGLEDEIFELQSERFCATVCSARLFLERHRRGGALDESFGAGGRSFSTPAVDPVSPNASFRQVASLAVTPTDEVVVATLDGGNLVLFRFDRLGRLSAGFGNSGRVNTTLGGLDGPPRLAISSDGRILVAASSRRQDGGSFVWLARFNSNGEPDPTFGAGLGQTVAPGALAIPAPSAAALDLAPSDRIALGGVRCCPGKLSSVFFGRRDPDGLPLRPYSAVKPWRNLKVSEPSLVSAVLALPGGRIAMVASSKAGAFVARLLPSGRPDRRFGRAGIVRLKHLQIGVSPALADSAGNIYVAGYRVGPEGGFAPDPAVVARVTSRGRVDRRFGATPPGYALMPSAISNPLAMGFQSSGKLVVFGEYIDYCIRGCPLPDRVLTRLYTSRRQGR